MTHIYVDMARDCWHTARWQDKLRICCGRTGWRPDDVAQKFPQAKIGLESFEKYDPPIRSAVAVYCFVQLIAIVVLLNYMQMQTLSYMQGAILYCFMFASALTIALWLEAQESDAVLRWEKLRLAILFALLGLGWWSGFYPTALLAAALYGGLNILVLQTLRVHSGPRIRTAL